MAPSVASAALGLDPASLVQICFGEPSAGQAAGNPFGTASPDKRSSARRRVLLSALVVNRELDTIFRCQVRDVSDDGARLSLPDSFLVPAGFWLIALSAGVAFDARLAWRRDSHVGVALGEPIDLDEPTTSVWRRLRAMRISALS